MNKKTLSESDICDKFIRPAMERAGWNGMDQIYREYPLRAGRMVVRGRQAWRDASTKPRKPTWPNPWSNQRSPDPPTAQ